MAVKQSGVFFILQLRFSAVEESSAYACIHLYVRAMITGTPNNGWNPATFLICLKEGRLNKGIHTNDPSGCQLLLVASISTSIIHTIFTLCALSFMPAVQYQYPKIQK